MTYKEAVQKTLEEYAATRSPREVEFLQMFLADVEFKLLESEEQSVK